MPFSVFVVIGIVSIIAFLSGLIISILCRRAARVIGVILMVFALVVLVPGLVAITSPKVLSTDRVEKGYFALSVLETNSGDLYAISRRDGVEFRYYNPAESNEYRTLKPEYVSIEFLTKAELDAGMYPTVRFMEETDIPIYRYLFWAIEDIPATSTKRVIRAYLKVPQDKVYIE